MAEPEALRTYRIEFGLPFLLFALMAIYTSQESGSIRIENSLPTSESKSCPFDIRPNVEEFTITPLPSLASRAHFFDIDFAPCR